MKEVIYAWIRNMVFYQLLISIVMNLIPNDTYQKYIRFFLGMLFIVIAIQPVLQILHVSESMDLQYIQEMVEQELKENSLEFDMEGWQEPDGKSEEFDEGNEEG